MKWFRAMAVLLLLSAGTGAVAAWTGTDDCSLLQSQAADDECGAFCLTCLCCAQPRLSVDTGDVAAPALTTIHAETIVVSVPLSAPRKIPHVPKAALAG